MKTGSLQRDGSAVSITDVTTSGSTTAGAFAVSLTVTGAGAATIGGVSFTTGQSLVLEVNGPYDAVSYDATGTTVRIVEVTE